MAGRKVIERSTISSIKSLLNRAASNKSNLASAAFTCPCPTPFRLSFRQTPLFTSRLPVELSSGIESLMPLHSATASALLTSMLSSKVGQWGTLSEGFATPL